MSAFEPGDQVRYRGRLFVVAAVSRSGDQVTLRDDEGETLVARADRVAPA